MVFKMDGNRAKSYKKLFPDIDTTKEKLSLEDKINIVKTYVDPHVNTENPQFVEKIDAMDSYFPNLRYFVIEVGKITNPSNKMAGSTRSINFWTIRGWSLNEATEKVSLIQKRNSKRSVEYWLCRGFAEEAARVKVAEYQSETGKKFHKKYQDLGLSASVWSYKFWMQKGFDFQTSCEIVSSIQTKIAQKSSEKYTYEERKYFMPVFIEYWQKRYPDDYLPRFEKFLSERYKSSAFRSKIADGFCDILSSYFPGNKIYMKENEFGKWNHTTDSYMKFDYVDLTLGVCVEFNGDYWHRSSQEKDLQKKSFIESLGFKFYTVWESEYKENPDLCINNLLMELQNGTSN